MICPRSAILQSAAASIVAGILELTVSTAARIATFGLSTPRDTARSMAFWQMSTLSSSVGAMLIAAVGDDQHLVIGRHVHDEHVADAAARAQPRLLGHDGTQQLVGVQAPLHQELGLAATNELHRLGGRGVAVRRIDDCVFARGRSRFVSRSPAILAAGPTRIGTISPFAPASMRAGQCGFLAGVGDGRWHWFQASAPSSSCSYFPVPVVLESIGRPRLLPSASGRTAVSAISQAGLPQCAAARR